MAEHRHKRVSNARRVRPLRARAIVIAGPLAVLATAGAVTLGVAQADTGTSDSLLAQSISDVATDATDDAPEGAADPASPPREQLVAPDRRLGTVSRGTARNATKAPPTEAELLMAAPLVKKAIAGASAKMWTTELLNLWTGPGDKATQVGEIDAGEQVLLTGRSLAGRDEIVLDGASRWVSAGYFSEEEPSSFGGECTNGTSVPSGVSPNIVKVHEAVCAEFPEITTYGTFRDDGEHGQGLAVDIMVSGDRGYEVAEFVREYYVELGVNYLIYSQEIWSVDRAGEGWRGMEDRGSTTANHYDHVHVTTY